MRTGHAPDEDGPVSFIDTVDHGVPLRQPDTQIRRA